jgi:hypothetical protein
LILLIVTIGLLNICLGLGLAMYYGYGPPGLDGIFEAIGPMPPDAESLCDLIVAPVAAESTVEPAANLSDANTTAPPSESPSETMAEPLAEEAVLGDVRDLATTAQTAMVDGQVENQE